MISATTDFTPWASLAGGAVIGVSSVLVMLFFGRIAGIVGVAARALRLAATSADDRPWRMAFVAGLVAAPLLAMLVTGQPVEQTVSSNLAAMALAGLLVGFGTTLGAGCTSGHGVCGLARLSPRSIVAVIAFMGSAAATVFVLRHVVGGAL